MSQRHDRSKGHVVITILRVLFTLFLLGSIALIFVQSSQIGAVSGASSAAVTAWLNRQMARFGIGFSFTEGLVRKLAHLAEYALLGFWTMLTLRVYTRRILAFSAWPMLLGLLTAVLDEVNQLRIPGRSGLVTDVVIDFLGVLFGVCLALFIQLLAGAIFWPLTHRKSSKGVLNGFDE